MLGVNCMELRLCISEDIERHLARGAILCTSEQLDDCYLMHYRRGGEKKGVRNWQNADGSYKPGGYEHYAEMYGWGKGRNNPGRQSSKNSKTEKPGATEDQKKIRNNVSAAARLGSAAVGTFGAAAVGTRLASIAASRHHLASVIQRMDAKKISDVATRLYTMALSLREAKIAEAFSHVADVTSVLGTAAVVAFGIGAISYGAIAAYVKIRSTLAKRKFESDTAKDKELKHAGDEPATYADILDSMNDDQKLAVIEYLDVVLKQNKS